MARKAGAEHKKQRRPRRKFTEEFKAAAVRLVLDEGKSVTGVAQDLAPAMFVPLGDPVVDQLHAVNP